MIRVLDPTTHAPLILAQAGRAWVIEETKRLARELGVLSCPPPHLLQ